MKIFAAESSCDESALAVFDSGRGVVAERVNTQIALHGQFGGVVPDLAAREHLANFPALLEDICRSVDPAEIDAVAVTRGPGLAGCLALGIAYARAVAAAWGKPIAAVNHLRGHLFSPFIPVHEEDPAAFPRRRAALFPHLGLVVSGGNTLLVSVDAECRVEILAQTVDDAAGEAFDKGAKLLGMPYPGGALIEKQARLAANGVGSQSITLGVRPEHIALSDEGQNVLNGVVDVVELMGSTVNLHVNAYGHDSVIVAQAASLMEHAGIVKTGDAVSFSFSGNTVHFFSRETGLNLE